MHENDNDPTSRAVSVVGMLVSEARSVKTLRILCTAASQPASLKWQKGVEHTLPSLLGACDIAQAVHLRRWGLVGRTITRRDGCWSGGSTWTWVG